MAGITLGRRATALYFRAAAVTIHKDKSVQCTIYVTNTGNTTIPNDDARLTIFYVLELSAVAGRTCEDVFYAWGNEVYYEGGVFSTTYNDAAIAPDASYTYTVLTSAADIPLGLIDAGFVLALDTDGDGTIDTFTDCLLAKDAFEVVEAPEKWEASLGTPTFSEV